MNKEYIELNFSNENVIGIYTLKPRGQWYSHGEEGEALSNFRYISEQLGIDISNFIRPTEGGGSEVAVVTNSHLGSGVTDKVILEDVDAMITNLHHVALCITVSDCAPVYLYDPVRGVIALAHSGRSGTAANIAGKTVCKMQNEYGCRPENLEAVIGPHICNQCYCVDGDTAEKFAQNFLNDVQAEVMEKRHEEYYINLTAGIMYQLEESGLRRDNIKVFDTCTYEDEDMYSYRAGDGIESSLAVIAYK